MTLSAMPASFAPSLPSLPTYPRHIHPSSAVHPSKRRTAPSPVPSDPDAMTHSFYSDSEYRSTLITNNTRKRGFADEGDVDDFGYPIADAQERAANRGERQGGGKRRIIDVVGSTVGGVLRGAWQMFKPRFPFSYGTSSTPKEKEMTMFAPPAEPTRETSPMPGRWDDDGGGSTATRVGSTPLDTGLATRWVMVNDCSPSGSPSPISASPAPFRPTSSGGRRRPTSSPSMGAPRIRPRAVPKKRVMRSPIVTSPLHTPTAEKRHKRAMSRDTGFAAVADEDEMDEDMKRFNDRLKAMIKEGKEALGATVEVVYDEDDDF